MWKHFTDCTFNYPRAFRRKSGDYVIASVRPSVRPSVISAISSYTIIPRNVKLLWEIALYIQIRAKLKKKILTPLTPFFCLLFLFLFAISSYTIIPRNVKHTYSIPLCIQILATCLNFFLSHSNLRNSDFSDFTQKWIFCFMGEWNFPYPVQVWEIQILLI